MITAPLRPIPEAYWVVPGLLLAGEYPGSFDPDAARKRIVTFVERGECSLSSLSLILSSVFGAESDIETALRQIDKQRVRTLLCNLHESTGISYFRPSRLLDETGN